MANLLITIDVNKADGAKVKEAMAELQSALNGIRELKSRADRACGGGVDKANNADLAAIFGIAQAATGAFYDDIANLKALIDVATVTNALSDLG